MRPLYLGGHRLKTSHGAMGAWHSVRSEAPKKAREFRVDEYVGHGDAGMGPVSEWFKKVFVRTCRTVFGTGLDPEHME